MVLFSSPTCSKCTDIKEGYDLPSLGIEVAELTEDNADGLALLAWHSLVKKAEEGLPILLVEKENLVLRGAESISKYLERIKHNN